MAEVTMKLKKRETKKHSVQYEDADSTTPFPYRIYVPNVVLEKMGNPQGDIEVVFRTIDQGETNMPVIPEYQPLRFTSKGVQAVYAGIVLGSEANIHEQACKALWEAFYPNSFNQDDMGRILADQGYSKLDHDLLIDGGYVTPTNKARAVA